MPSIILPKANIEKFPEPLIFLAGPIRGAPEWQNDAIRYIFSKVFNGTIANPRREVSSDLTAYLLSNTENFDRQRRWEWNYQIKATDSKRAGALMFWLPGEKTHNCNKSYGAMTRIELGQWMGRYATNKHLRISMGTDGNFSEWDTIKFDLENIYGYKNPIFRTLEETCDDALKIAVNQNSVADKIVIRESGIDKFDKDKLGKNMLLLDKLPEEDRNLIAEHIGEYYNWLSGEGGKHPDEILSYPHTIDQRKALLSAMDDINVVMGYFNQKRNER